jgi:hypothetical protein
MTKDFIRGREPKKSMRIGLDVPKQKGDRFKVFKEMNSKEMIEVEALEEEKKKLSEFSLGYNKFVEKKSVACIIPQTGEIVYAHSADYALGKWWIER